MTGTASRSLIRIVLSVLLLSVATEPAAMAGNVTVTDVRDLAGFCETYLQNHTDWLRTAVSRIVEDHGSDTSGGLLVSEERTYVEDERLRYDATYGTGRPMFEGGGGIHVYRLIRRLSRGH